MQKSNECKPLIFIIRPIKHSNRKKYDSDVKTAVENGVWKHDENKCKSIFIGRMPMCLFPTLVYLN